MKYIVIGDNHFCEKSSVINGRGETYSDRIENQKKSFEWVKSFGLPIIHVGDFFDKSFLKAEEVQAFTDEIKPLISGTDNIFLLGNHEYSGSYDLLSPLGGRIIRKPLSTFLDSKKVLFLPFNSTEDDIPDENFDIIFGHIGIKDIPFGAKGFDFEKIDKHCKMFLNGHLHNRYKFGENKWNIGSLTAQNFSDNCIDYLKGAVILDTDKMSLEFVVNPYAFNFFKINWEDFRDHCKNQELWEAITSNTSCVSISGKEGCKEEIKQSGKFDKVYYLRISEQTTHSIKDPLGDSPVTTIDHVDKFRKSFIEKVGESKVVFEELAEVFR